MVCPFHALRAACRFWVPRPSQADPGIKPRIGLPNHPSYPSNHSCDSGAAAYVLGEIFPRERSTLLAQAEEAGESRIDGGLHYRFDLDAGLAIGRAAAGSAIRHAGGVATLPPARDSGSTAAFAAPAAR